MAEEKPKDDKPKVDAKPKVEEKPPEKDFGLQIVEMLFYLFLIATLLGGVLSSVTGFLSGSGVKGFSVERLMGTYTRPFEAVLNPIGESATVTSAKTEVYDEAGGKTIGTQKRFAKGVVKKGPVEIGGVKYWYIDFESGPDGWVAQDDIAVIKSNPSLFVKLLLGLYKIGAWLRYFLWFLILILTGVIVYVLYNLTQVRKNVRMKLNQVNDETISVPISTNKNWDRVILHVESHNESEWRLAVIEADIMLAELLDTMNLGGDSIGDKLKGVEKSDFNTLDLAWEAHKVRNQIAHDPSFLLTQREARRVIALYEAVFKEFSFV
jgi:hypothetical protein